MVDLTVLTVMALLHMVGARSVQHAGSGDFAGNRADPIEVQFQQIKDRMHENGVRVNILLTSKPLLTPHAPVEVLKKNMNQVGLSFATRPDCLPDDVVEYLAELNERTYLGELGLQTVHRNYRFN